MPSKREKNTLLIVVLLLFMFLCMSVFSCVFSFDATSVVMTYLVIFTCQYYLLSLKHFRQ